jgi:hypothetical protein
MLIKENGGVGGMLAGGAVALGEESAPALPCPPQIPRDLTGDHAVFIWGNIFSTRYTEGSVCVTSGYGGQDKTTRIMFQSSVPE